MPWEDLSRAAEPAQHLADEHDLVPFAERQPRRVDVTTPSVVVQRLVLQLFEEHDHSPRFRVQVSCPPEGLGQWKTSLEKTFEHGDE